MTHWGWYWNIKRKGHRRRISCSNMWLCEIDSFAMYNRYHQIEGVRLSSSKNALYIPRYELNAYLQDDNSLLVQYSQGSYIIPVEKMACNLGGYTHYFRCPLCSKRMRKLYCLEGQYQCRKCGNLAYYSQRLRARNRLRLKMYEIRSYVQNRGGSLNDSRYHGHKKPLRMHNKTFQKLKDKSLYYKAKADLENFKELRRWYPKFEDYIDSYFECEAKWIIKEYENKHLTE